MQITRYLRLCLLLPLFASGVPVLAGDVGRGLDFVSQADNRELRPPRPPVDIAIGDLDGNGRSDVVTGNTTAGGPSTVSVMLQLDAQTFVSQRDAVAGEGLLAIALADLTGDGNLDVVTAGGESVHVLTGDGSGVVTTVLTVDGLGDARAMTLEDLDGDGHIDILTVDRTSSVVIVIEGRGDGSFSEPLRYETGGRPVDIVSADLDGDGVPEVVTANERTRDISVLTRQGERLGAPVAYALNGRPRLLESRDLDSDGQQDLITALGGTLFGLLGDGTGALAVPVAVYDGEGTLGSYAFGHIDGDPFQDLIPGTGRGVLPIAFGTGELPWTVTRNLPADATVARVRIEDLDGDGDSDVIALTTAPASVNVYWRDTRGRIPLEVVGSPHLGFRPHAAMAADFDGDGLDDVVIGNGSDHGISLFSNRGDGTLAAPVTRSVVEYIESVSPADVDGDGDLDVVATDPEAGTLIIIENNSGAFGDFLTFESGRRAFMVASDDMDQDGDPDAVVANADGNNIAILFNDGSGNFTRTARTAVGSRPVAVALADLNGSGHLDVAVSNAVSQELMVLPGSSDGTLGVGVTYPSPGSSLYVAATDLDEDGALDLLTANEGTADRAWVLVNDGQGAFRDGGGYATGQAPYTVIAVDLDGDGHQDAVTVSQTANGVAVLAGSGDGTFGTLSLYGVGEDPRAVMSIDLDRDGLLDLVTANHTSQDLTILLNRVEVSSSTEGVAFQRGDVNADSATNLTDGVTVLEFVFGRAAAPGCLRSADVDDNGRVNVVDAVYVLRFVAGRGLAPPPPFPKCGGDTTPDTLACRSFLACE